MNLMIIPSRASSALPETACNAIARATRDELALLAVLLAAPALGMDYERHLSDLTALTGIAEKKIEPSLQFWRGAGVLVITDGDEETPPAQPVPMAAVIGTAETSQVRALLSADSRAYTGKELETLLCANDNLLRHLIDECQMMAGKMFSPTEVGKIVFLSDQLGMETEHILLLYTYCIGRGKTSVSYLEKTAVNLFNEGVDTAEAFEAYLKRREVIASYEGKIRVMFGIGERAWTPAEKKYLQAWREDWSCPAELVERAFQICVDARGSLSFPYMNKILQNWHTEGIHTVEEADAARAAYKAGNTAGKTPSGKASGKPSGSFETDEFIELALKRSRSANRKTGKTDA